MELLLQIWLTNIVLLVSIVLVSVFKYNRYEDTPVWGQFLIKATSSISLAMLIALALGKIWA